MSFAIATHSHKSLRHNKQQLKEPQILNNIQKNRSKAEFHAEKKKPNKLEVTGNSKQVKNRS